MQGQLLNRRSLPKNLSEMTQICCWNVPWSPLQIWSLAPHYLKHVIHSVWKPLKNVSLYKWAEVIFKLGSYEFSRQKSFFNIWMKRTWIGKQTLTVCHSNIMFSLMGHFCWFLNSVVYYVPSFRNRPSARMQFHHPVVKKSWLVYHLDLFSRADALIGDFSSALLLPPIFLFPLTNVSVSSHRIF